ncbi:MAG TPA: adenylate/guanylate cyclase domain-containing protein [Acidimicrobiia bacterium]|nr:adenylate/guanylate cyclase domain-containing protein [Acidimicrobiia bacterium]
MAEVPETRYAKHGGVHLAYQVLGASPPDLCYLTWPNAPVDLMWDDPLCSRGLRRLASVGRLITCDARGWGSSDPVDRQHVPALQAWMDDLLAVLDEVGSVRTALLGVAEAALPGMLLAASHPERVSTLVLVDAFARFSRADDYPWGMPSDALDKWIGLYEANVGTGRIAETYAPSRAAERHYRRWASRAERLSAPPNSAHGQYSMFAHTDVRGVLSSISAPTLVLHRRDNPVVRAGHARHLAEHIPNARLLELPGADTVWFAGDVDRLVDEVVAFVSGQRAPAPRGDRTLATILFTDIVGSTRQAARVGDTRWRSLLEQHHDLVAAIVEGFRGRLIKSTGDGTLSVFDGPARAVQCACAVRDESSVLNLQIRAGVHTGEIERMGDDIGGIAVHIGARVAGLAEADEVLTSSAVPPLVVGSGIVFEDRGEHELRGIPEPWRLFAVRSG